MREFPFDHAQIKAALEAALIEVLQERPDLFTDIVTEVVEDAALLRAIAQVDDSDRVSRDEIFRSLESRG